MDKQSIIRDLKAHQGGKSFINQTQIAEYMGVSRNKVREMVSGTDYIATGKERKYFIGDIAGLIMGERNLGSRMI